MQTTQNATIYQHYGDGDKPVAPQPLTKRFLFVRDQENVEPKVAAEHFLNSRKPKQSGNMQSSIILLKYSI